MGAQARIGTQADEISDGTANTAPARSASAESQHDAELAVAFLERVHPAGPWVLSRLGPDGMVTRTFCRGDEPEMSRWIERYNGKENLYYHVARPLRPLNSKARKEDIGDVPYLHVDLDPADGVDLDAERTRILNLLQSPPDGVPLPTVIVDSGNGYQALYRLEEAAPVNGSTDCAAAVESHTRWLEAQLGGDKTHNVDRLLRLPGTINIPNAKKEAMGRRRTTSRLVEFHDERTYSLAEFPTLAPKEIAPRTQARHTVTAEPAAKLTDVHDLDQWKVPTRVKSIIANGPDPDHPKAGDNSRSGWLFDVLCNLVRCSVPDELCLSIILDPSFPISACVLEKPNPLSVARRQLERAHEHVANDESGHEDFNRTEKNVIVRDDQHNIRVALSRLGVSLTHDVFQDRLLISGLAGLGPRLDDRVIERLWLLVDERFGFRPGKDFFWVVVSDTARRNPYHPVCEYLDGLTWDGKRRLDRWLVTYGGAEDTPYVRAVGGLALLAAARRVRQPGAKFDEMLVLESSQGEQKSTALAVLAVEEDWFSDDLPLNADGKRVIEALAGRWIVEAAELKGMRKGEVEHLKSFLSRRTDRARMSYDRLVSEVPRQCVIVGTTNSAHYLRDGTGNRRFWPVAVTRFDIDALRRDRDQLWAEAAYRESQGESIRLDTSLYEAAAEQQTERRVEDPFLALLANALGDMEGKLDSNDAWDIVGIDPARRQQEHNARLGDAMRELGWERKKLRLKGRPPTWCYVRGNSARLITIRRGDDGRVFAIQEEAGVELPF